MGYKLYIIYINISAFHFCRENGKKKGKQKNPSLMSDLKYKNPTIQNI